ncbi:MAG: hypothetical protein AB7O45_08965 [Alphaproteobacteria bacterium]
MTGVPRLRTLAATLGIALHLPFAATVLAQAVEAPPVLRAQDVLPPPLVRGPHHSVDPAVYVRSFMHEYRVRSEFGTYEVGGDSRLRILVRELAAIAELRKFKQTDAFLEAAKNAATGPFRAVRNLVEDPAGTLSGIPNAAADVFNRVGEQFRRGRRTQYEDSSAAALLAVSSFKRDLARKLGVNVYSTNEALQKELNSVAWASAAGNLSLGAVSVATGAAVLQVAGYVRVLDQAKEVIAAEPPAEISRRSRRTLTGIGISKDRVDRFLAHLSFSARHQFLIVTSLQLMEGVGGRERFLDAAMTARSEADAHLFQQTAEMMAGYHRTVRPLARISADWGFPVGLLPGGQVVVLAPVDHVFWTDRAADFFARLPSRPARTDQRGRRGAEAALGEVWLTGDVSPRARQEIARRGYALHVRGGNRIAIAD